MWDGTGIERTRSLSPHALTLISLTAFSPPLTANEKGDGALMHASALPSAIHATRLDYSEFEVPEAVTIITQDDIRRAGYLEVSEIFRSVPGFRIVKVGDESRVSYHGTIVSQNRRMLITIDGRSVLIGDSQYVEFDRLPIELEDIERVTITRGPNGAAYGDNAFLASVDFKTTGRDALHGVSIRASGGHNDRSKLATSINKQLGGYDVQFSAGAERDGGYDYYDALKTPRDDGKDTQRARLAVEREFVAGSRWRLDSSVYESDNETGIQLVRFSGEQENDGKFIALSHEQELSEFSRLDWFVSHNRQRESLRQAGCYTPEAIAGALAVVTDPELQAGLLAPTLFVPRILGVPLADTCFFLDIATESKRSELEIELESRRGAWRYSLGASATQVDASSAQRFAGIDQRQRSYRVFGEMALTMGAVHASLGFMAQDSDNMKDTEPAWRGALNWLFQSNQALRYSYARSFRIPSLVETETLWTGVYRFGRRGEPFSSYQLGIPLPLMTSTTRLKPETIDSHSIGYFGSFLASSATIDFKLFRKTIRDRVESDVFYFSRPPFNGDSFTLSGAETEIALRLSERWRLSGHYSYLDTNARAAFERGMHGDHAGSLAVTYRPYSSHEFTLGYYGNSTISGNSYDRYDLVYNYDRPIGKWLLRSQLIFQHHIGGVDGVRGDVPFQRNEGYFEHLNQVFQVRADVLSMARRALLVTVGTAVTAATIAGSATLWIATPTQADLSLPPPLKPWTSDPAHVAGEYNKDLAPLTQSFEPQIYRSFCGPASIATILRAYGAKRADQAAIFPSLPFKLDVFYTGMSLAELAGLASAAGLHSEIVYADTLDLNTFRERLKTNLKRQGDFVVINYDRRILKQAGAGHISPVGAYDKARDSFLVLDEAAYRYPFTWVPAPLLYQAAHTRSGDHYRGVLFISAYHASDGSTVYSR